MLAQTKLDDNVIQIQNLPTWACACMHSVFNHLTFTSLLLWIVREALIEKYILSLLKIIILIVEIAGYFLKFLTNYKL